VEKESDEEWDVAPIRVRGEALALVLTARWVYEKRLVL
jgi:hypothetical protein